MKLNLHVPFKAWNGEEIKERKGEEEKAKMIDETVSLLLFSGDFYPSVVGCRDGHETEACLL